MKFGVLQVLGMVLTAVGAQGAIRLLIDHGNVGLLGWLGAGSPGRWSATSSRRRSGSCSRAGRTTAPRPPATGSSGFRPPMRPAG